MLLLSHFSRARLCASPQTAAHQAPLSLGFSRQEHWSGVPLTPDIIDIFICIGFLSLSLFFNKFAFTYFWLCWVFVALRAFSSCDARASHRGGFSGCGAQAVGCMGFRSSGFWALEHRLTSCSAACGILPGQGSIEPTSPALAG